MSTPSPTERPCALVVDDDALLLMNAAVILEDAGYRTLEAHSGDAALDVLREHHATVQLLFTDVHMPGDHDGFALATKVADHWPHIAIVIASGRARPTPDELPDSAHFIPKPFSARVVREHLRDMLPKAEQPSPLRG